MTRRRVPSLLVIGGHDPSGAGIQADIETCAAFKCHAACVVTAVTAQNSRTVSRVEPVDPGLIVEQGRRLLEEHSFGACKIGLIPSIATLEAVCELLDSWRKPVIVDPVLAAGCGTPLTEDRMAAALLSRLLPYATVCTPNLCEGRTLSACMNPDEIGAHLGLSGCEWVLLTGADEPTAAVSNRLYHRGRWISEFSWPRLPGSYHGSGCTLATSIAAQLSGGTDVIEAVEKAQRFTWQSLRTAIDLGTAQFIPNRWCDAVSDDER